MKKLAIVIAELDNASIRRTPDGRLSVFDLISIIGQQKNPHQVWNRLLERFPEVLPKCENFKFPGRGQRETPVTDREGWAYIMGLLPGVIGHLYRESAATLVLKYLDADISLACDIVERNDNDEDMEHLEARIKSKKIRKQLTRTLSRRGVVQSKDYARCTNQTYQGLYGKTAKGLKKQKDLPEKSNLRNYMTTTELVDVTFAESLADRKINKDNSYGVDTCSYDCYNTAKSVAKLIQHTLGI